MSNQRPIYILLITALIVIIGGHGYAQPNNPDARRLERIDVKEHLGESISKELTFTRHDGQEVTLGSYFDGEKPVILTLNYYDCPMLCSLQLNGLIDGLKELGWIPGEDYRIVTISIDPEETVELASAKRSSYLDSLGMGDNVAWDFLVGDKAEIEAIANDVGFEYEYVPDLDEYAHPAALYLLSPKGKITRYLYGLQYDAFQLKMGILEAGKGKVGSTVDKIILSCFHYDADRNSYSPFAFGMIRIGGILTLLLFGGGLAILWIRDIRKKLSSN